MRPAASANNAPCADVRRVLTPDIKAPGGSTLVLVDVSAAAGAPRHPAPPPGARDYEIATMNV